MGFRENYKANMLECLHLGNLNEGFVGICFTVFEFFCKYEVSKEKVKCIS